MHKGWLQGKRASGREGNITLKAKKRIRDVRTTGWHLAQVMEQARLTEKRASPTCPGTCMMVCRSGLMEQVVCGDPPEQREARRGRKGTLENCHLPGSPVITLLVNDSVLTPHGSDV